MFSTQGCIAMKAPFLALALKWIPLNLLGTPPVCFCANIHNNNGGGFGDADHVTYHFMNTYSMPNKALSAVVHFSFDPPNKPVRLAYKIIPILQIN